MEPGDIDQTILVALALCRIRLDQSQVDLTYSIGKDIPKVTGAMSKAAMRS
jgi:hypothetical protein